MKLIQDAKRTALVSYSMLAFYALAAVTLAPDAIYLALGIETNPVIWSVVQLAVIAAGIAGRLVLQTPQGAWMRRT